jgi:hypothetical protein
MSKKKKEKMKKKHARRAEKEAENRRQLLEKLSPETRAYAVGEFAKLGLRQ